ncbi:AAA family ATPase [Glaciecola sp. MH2013]|uniref:DEAD/DEAH box helicase n=1 Tax=Glaciecola sp. MH2013 TaxID=2785524 RepID=UPI00189D2F35|nr:AAA domain-containing protein [Glaciecola sp. MH2013]MBF7072397.1 AAA family ATPase [Glaciecola sp. MH2013]
MQEAKIVEYYRACYAADSADFNLRNLFRLASSDIVFLKGNDEVAVNEIHRAALLPKSAEALSKKAQIYLREKTLLHCCLFICGKASLLSPSTSSFASSSSIFSPLIYRQAKIETDEYGHYFSSSDARVNEDLLAMLLPNTEQLPAIDTTRIHDPSYWSEYLKYSPFNIDISPAMRFPKLSTKKIAEDATSANLLSVQPISTLALIDRSTSSRGILHELTKIGKFFSDKASNNPTSLLSLLGKNDTNSANKNTEKLQYPYLPCVFSRAQIDIMRIASEESLGVVTGPPGTGKSFTIAGVAAEHMLRGKSTLIVAGSETALDVIANKLSIDFALENSFIRSGQKVFLKQLKLYLSDLLSGQHKLAQAGKHQTLSAEIQKHVAAIHNIESQLTALHIKAEKQGKRSYRLQNSQGSLWDALMFKLERSLFAKVGGDIDSIWEKLDTFKALVASKENLSKQYLHASKTTKIATLLSHDRPTIQGLNKAIRARSSSKQSEYFRAVNFASLLSGFPIWLVSTSTLHKVLPLQAELFDLVIIDEASQCNIAASLPAVYRAKRAMIVGDQKQLRHFSFLAKQKENQIAEELALSEEQKIVSYRDNSILDLAIDCVREQRQVSFLDEHYRSEPELIAFSNKHFYSERLRIMQHRPCASAGHLHVHSFNGKRNNQGINKVEAEALLAYLLTSIEEDADKPISRTIGVLSPYSKQLSYIASLIEKAISIELLEKHDIKVATPYGFQGEERDLMLMSFAIDNDSARSATYLNKEDMFNVAITRAKSAQHLFLSVDKLALNPSNLLRKYLDSIDSFKSAHAEDKQPDAFQQSVKEALEKRGLSCWVGYEVLGNYVDLLVSKNKQYLVIDLIGYPGPWEGFYEMNMYKLIQRAGLNIVAIPYLLWCEQSERCIENVLASLSPSVESRP